MDLETVYCGRCGPCEMYTTTEPSEIFEANSRKNMESNGLLNVLKRTRLKNSMASHAKGVSITAIALRYCSRHIVFTSGNLPRGLFNACNANVTFPSCFVLFFHSGKLLYDTVKNNLSHNVSKDFCIAVCMQQKSNKKSSDSKESSSAF